MKDHKPIAIALTNFKEFVEDGLKTGLYELYDSDEEFLHEMLQSFFAAKIKIPEPPEEP